uniref:Uncharacterized protein n=1 Tax=Pseudo-nitzschia australis TaxID=44445 RepID=A0A7S4ASF2_9STRA|mmetsp:Transcript_1780/g.3964  ORF Transcript_1780/g.3964 Transcript_1780/m.3964 type:complete len:321 (-) Transcript_1780:390-1352(-)|eukprot:CAMPEP_0168177354 /NCGR_PEP_ID=MMETSP0139_2-20121125/8396_1 /TAXON_ID=44445 /ORGANISM="Pseudo-nitzschia australis, Strain 10249 10 AB" /LENGTH=320 /DNA_ID=CAMNT_0008096373 /DNA_START=228 /DNA_END=1190 /DNA_ORIENTATION=-
MVQPDRFMCMYLLLSAAGNNPAASFQLDTNKYGRTRSTIRTSSSIVGPCKSTSATSSTATKSRSIRTSSYQQSRLFAAGSGFGKNSANYKPPKKSYGKKELEPIKDLIDEESGMREFFESNEPWQPLFRSLAKDDSVPASSFLNNVDAGAIFEFSETSSPWKKMAAIPTAETDIEVLGQFLDAMQKSLIEDIPVDETTKDDDNDLHFIEEGRRMLVCSRYHVVQGIEKGSVETFDKLFSICWSELMELRETDEPDTGSLIVTPGFDYDDLRRFVDMNLQRPLQWLGVDGFEVASLEKGGLGVIRIIHKLSDIPTEMPERG